MSKEDGVGQILYSLPFRATLANASGALGDQYATPKRFATCCGRSSSSSTATA